MITVFTLCSANYLAHAKTLGDSLTEHNPGYQFVIGLVDRVPNGLESSFWRPYELIPVGDLNISSFEEMMQKYEVVELNTAVKPFYMDYLYRRDSSVEHLIYLDPDILVCGSFEPLAQKLRSYNIIVTPHSCTFDDTPVNVTYEIAMMRTGIYNLGFIATSRTDTTFTFLRWWQNRLRNYCYYRVGPGMFVDQIWMTLAPLYFAGIYVEKNPGYNVCYWNHFERYLSQQNGRYVVNGEFDLIFYHFSSYDPMEPDVIAKRLGQRIASFKDRPDLRPIYDDYRRRLLTRDYASARCFSCSLGRKPLTRSARLKRIVTTFAREFLNALPIGIQKPVRRLARCRRYLGFGKPLGRPSEESVWLLR